MSQIFNLNAENQCKSVKAIPTCIGSKQQSFE